MLSCIRWNRVSLRIFFTTAFAHINMTRNSKKYSAILAVLVIGLLSIYAVNMQFNSANQTQHQLNITLNMQSGAQLPVALAPGQNLPTPLNGDQVVSVTVAGAPVPAGINAVVGTPNGNITIMWQMAGGQPAGIISLPDVETVS